MKRAAILGVFLAVLDVVVTRRSWRKKLMMSKADVKREHKESEGDPQLKAARERAHHEMLAAATVANVQKASVVIVNPVHIACALRYDEEDGDEAPVVVASGHGDLAARIVQAARAHGVPVLQDIPLARALVELEVGSAIPEALYEAVAEILREAWSRPTPHLSAPASTRSDADEAERPTERRCGGPGLGASRPPRGPARCRASRGTRGTPSAPCSSSACRARASASMPSSSASCGRPATESATPSASDVWQRCLWSAGIERGARAT